MQRGRAVTGKRDGGGRTGAGVTAATSGFLLGLSLIMAIGAQNAFVLRQGLRREHVLAVCLACAGSDAILIAAGVGGMGWLAREMPWLAPAMTWAGAAFLAVYGAMSFRRALRPGALEVTGQGAGSLRAALLTCLALTWLNPHVWLDTVVLLGSVSAQYPGEGVAFALGATTASFVFFFALGFGARALAPVFARPAAWRVLDLCVGAVMWAIAAKLVLS
jgi:L-lysine exporter family protein LysE/ArgO